MTTSLRTFFASASLTVFLTTSLYAASPQPIPIWPHTAPDEKGDIGPEKDMSKPGEGLIAGKPLIRLGNVSKPEITIFRPPKNKDTGAAVVVFPGGGYSILAYDLEGSEVCQWLNSIGITGVLLKYRVPARKGQPRYQAPLQDAQRAVGLVRFHAAEWHLDPGRIGVLGFSAGGHLAAAISNNFEKRIYEPVDDADRVSCRPDFAILIYPAYLAENDNLQKVSPELPVSANTPPTFIVQTENDPVKVDGAIAYYLALRQAKVPVDMHLYSEGKHGYGLRRTSELVTTWPQRVEEWLRSRGTLRAKS